MSAIDSFSGKYRFLSNFWQVWVIYEKVAYSSTEHAYQAAKSLDVECRKRIAKLSTSAEAKKAGKTVALRPGWEQAKLEIMEEILRLKFAHDDLAAQLVETQGHELIEGNTWGDRYWGVCRGAGENHLGKLLMKIREELLEKSLETPSPKSGLGSNKTLDTCVPEQAKSLTHAPTEKQESESVCVESREDTFEIGSVKRRVGTSSVDDSEAATGKCASGSERALRERQGTTASVNAIVDSDSNPKNNDNRSVEMAQLPKDMADDVGKSRVAGGGVYIQYGDYVMMVEKWFYQKIQDRCVILNIIPVEAKKKVVFEGDNKIEKDPNPVGQPCSSTANFDGAAKLSAPSNARAPVLGLFGLKENDVPDAKVSETLSYVCNDPTPAAGMLLTCSAYPKEIRSKKGEYITGLEWDCVAKPGEGLNAAPMVKARLDAFAISPENGVAVAVKQLAEARAAGTLGALAAPAAPAAPVGPGGPPAPVGVAPVSPTPPAPPSPPVAPAPPKNPFDGWTKNDRAPGWWYKANPTMPGGYEQKLETDIAAGR